MSGARRIGLVTLLVADYDEADAWFREKLAFTPVENTPVSPNKRWLVLAPPGGDGAGLLLAKADTAEQRAGIGRQGGGRVFLFLYTDDFSRDHRRMTASGVRFLEAPRSERYGTVAVFEDLYGNRWDLIGPPPAADA